jgi:protein-S-isoprenylcysteine O-methyltransferase Ste14
MNLKRQSRLAFAVMVIGLLWMFQRQEIIARSLPAQIVQGCAVGLMIAARITFGRRSFHAAANPTAGGLVTTGPYRWLRHPIYAAIMYFVWSTALDHRSYGAIAAAALVTAGAVVRMYAEETLLVGMYPEYATYRASTARVIPFLL